MRRFISFWIVATVSTAAAGAQVVRPPRDGADARPASVGTAAISGQVVDAQSGKAVAHARVRLNWNGAGVQRPPITTDASGRFAFSNLPEGLFSLFAERATYLFARYPAGGPTVRATSRPMSLADGQTL